MGTGDDAGEGAGDGVGEAAGDAAGEGEGAGDDDAVTLSHVAQLGHRLDVQELVVLHMLVSLNGFQPVQAPS